METICPRCGGSHFHYNRSRMRMECDTCGAPWLNPQQEQRLMEYDQTYAQALQHIQAGNWQQALQRLASLAGQYPTDKKLHEAIIQAATQDFSDMTMRETAPRRQAEASWNALVRLHGITPGLRRYAAQKQEQERERLQQQKARMRKWLFRAALCAIVLFLGLSFYSYSLVFLCFIGLLGCLYKVCLLDPLSLIYQARHPAPASSNPFTQSDWSYRIPISKNHR